MIKRETRIVTAECDADEVDAWLMPAFNGVSNDDLRINNFGMGTDDVPVMSLTQEVPAAQRDFWGEWGVTREVRWADYTDDPRGSVMVGGRLMSAGKYAVEFSKRNRMRVKLTLCYPCFSIQEN